MIFVSVGTRFGMDRLVEYADILASENPHLNWFAQIGGGEFKPHHMKHTQYLDDHSFKSTLSRSTLLISHAGIGNLLAARQLQIPVIIVPRQSRLKEHINDHQNDTARRVNQQVGIVAVDDLPGLRAAFLSCLKEPTSTRQRIENSQLVEFIASAISHE